MRVVAWLRGVGVVGALVADGAGAKCCECFRNVGWVRRVKQVRVQVAARGVTHPSGVGCEMGCGLLLVEPCDGHDAAFVAHLVQGVAPLSSSIHPLVQSHLRRFWAWIAGWTGCVVGGWVASPASVFASMFGLFPARFLSLSRVPSLVILCKILVRYASGFRAFPVAVSWSAMSASAWFARVSEGFCLFPPVSEREGLQPWVWLGCK